MWNRTKTSTKKKKRKITLYERGVQVIVECFTSVLENLEDD